MHWVLEPWTRTQSAGWPKRPRPASPLVIELLHGTDAADCMPFSSVPARHPFPPPLTQPRADGVVDRVPQHRARHEHGEQHTHVQLAHAREGTGGEQQRVARQEGRQHQACLAENDALGAQGGRGGAAAALASEFQDLSRSGSGPLKGTVQCWAKGGRGTPNRKAEACAGCTETAAAKRTRCYAVDSMHGTPPAPGGRTRRAHPEQRVSGCAVRLDEGRQVLVQVEHQADDGCGG